MDISWGIIINVNRQVQQQQELTEVTHRIAIWVPTPDKKCEKISL